MTLLFCVIIIALFQESGLQGQEEAMVISSDSLLGQREETVSNKSDQFFAGWYGIPGRKLEPFWKNSAEFLLNHGIDWIWIQDQVFSGHGANYKSPRFLLDGSNDVAESIKLLKKRARIFLEIMWGDKLSLDYVPIQDVQKLVGKSWNDFADSPELLGILKEMISWKIDKFTEICGKDSLYSVGWMEEEPLVSNRLTGKQQESQKIIYVANNLYEYIKSKYPSLRVALSFYPYAAMPVYKNAKYDDIIMDTYPGMGSDLKKPNPWVDASERIGKENVYILLWGVFTTREEIAWNKQVFQSVRDSGFKNIGWFQTAPDRSMDDYVAGIIDSESPGSYLPETIMERLASLIRRYNHIINTLDILNKSKELPAHILLKRKEMASLMSKTITLHNQHSNIQEVVTCMEQTGDIEKDLVAACVEYYDREVDLLRDKDALREIILCLSSQGVIPENMNQCLPDNLFKGTSLLTRFSSLAEFELKNRAIVDKCKNTIDQIVSEISNYMNEHKEPTVNGSLKKTIEYLKNNQINDALKMTYAVLSDMSVKGHLKGAILTAYIANAYRYAHCGSVRIRISQDKEHWIDAYTGRPTEKLTTLQEIPKKVEIQKWIKDVPAYVSVDIPYTFQGAIALDSVVLRTNDGISSATEAEAECKASGLKPIISKKENALGVPDGKYASLNNTGAGVVLRMQGVRKVSAEKQ
jgi:hypothetical protein